MRRAEVRMQDRPAGILEELENSYRFTYRPDYLESPGAMPVSWSLPLQPQPFEDKRLFPFFDGLIPEGWLLEIAERTWKLDPRDRMGLLLACCRDCIGAVGVVPLAKEDHQHG
jgi:serine/threonine-protein kinase HipA